MEEKTCQRSAQKAPTSREIVVGDKRGICLARTSENWKDGVRCWDHSTDRRVTDQNIHLAAPVLIWD